jgi:hypothetical protein
MSESLLALLSGAAAPGVYQWTSRAQVKTIQTTAQQHGWQCVHIDGRAIQDKAALLHAFARALHFPAYFGQNWDAFEECLRDLSWLPPAQGRLVLYDDVASLATHQPGAWQVALAILQEAVAFWQQQQPPLAVLLRKPGRGVINLPKLQ